MSRQILSHSFIKYKRINESHTFSQVIIVRFCREEVCVSVFDVFDDISASHLLGGADFL